MSDPISRRAFVKARGSAASAATSYPADLVTV